MLYINGAQSTTLSMLSSVNSIVGAPNAATNATSLAGRVNNINLNCATIADALTGVTYVYPTTAASLSMQCPATAWESTSVGACVATNAIAAAWNIRGLNIEGVSTVGIFEIEISEGTAGATVLFRKRFGIQSTAACLPHFDVWTKEIAANKALKCRVTADRTATATIKYSFDYVL